MSMSKTLSVVIPFYNEEENVERVLQEISTALRSAAIPYEYICVNNGSRDTTGTILARLSASDSSIRVVTVGKNQGYGFGVASGIKTAEKDWVTIVSGDGQVNPADIVKAYRKMEETRADIIKPRRVTRDDGLYREIVSYIYNLTMKILFRLPGWDFNAPPKIITREFLHSITLESKNSFLDPEILIKAARQKKKIMEVDVTYRERTRGRGHTNIRTVGEFIVDIIRWKFR